MCEVCKTVAVVATSGCLFSIYTGLKYKCLDRYFKLSKFLKKYPPVA